MYTFVTDMDIESIKKQVGEKMDLFDHVTKYTAMVGYCKNNMLVLFKVALSARFLILMRPFHAYMYRKSGKTIISGSFKFSFTTKILACAWFMNDFIRLVAKLHEPIPTDFIGHIISIVILPALLVQTVWKDKLLQYKVIDYMQTELDAKLDK